MASVGLISDYLEQNKEAASYDICLIIPRTKYTTGMYVPTTDGNPMDHQAMEDKQNWKQDFTDQAKFLHDAEMYGQMYSDAHTLINRCLYREKQLLAIQKDFDFATHIVRDTIVEYLALIHENMQYASGLLVEAKHHIKNSRISQFDLNEAEENKIAVSTLLNSVCTFLASSATFNESEYIHAIFHDIALLVGTLPEYDVIAKKAKDICRIYFEDIFHPTYGIDTCENCGRKLYKEIPYCFNCYERNGT